MEITMADPIDTAAPAPTTVEPSTTTEKPVRESLDQAMRRLGGYDEPSGEPSEDAETVEPSTTVQTQSEQPPTPVKAKPAPADKLGQLRAIAAELGLEVDGGKVLSKERIEFREWRNKQRASLAAREAEIVSKFEGLKGDFSGKLTKADAVLKAHEAGDPDALAKALGQADWNDLQASYMARLADPNYSKLRELENWKQQQAEREEQAARQQKEAQVQQAKAQAHQEYMTELQAQMAQSPDKTTKALSKLPLVLNAVFRIQQENWDESTQSTVSADQAIKMAVRGAKIALKDELQGLYQTLHEAFGSQQTFTPPKAKPAPKQPKPPVGEPRIEPRTNGKSFKDGRSHFRSFMANVDDD